MFTLHITFQKGFKFHHARDNYVTMYKWLPKDETSNIPSYAHTMIGVGGLVINDKSEVLVVNEKHLEHPHWKLPGGSVDPGMYNYPNESQFCYTHCYTLGENFIDAAIREVQEETNIKTSFHSLITLVHAHNIQFECSNLYIIVNLTPLNTDIVKCDREIAACQWMHTDEFLQHPHVSQFNKTIFNNYLELKKKNIRIIHKSGVHERLHIPYQIYHVVDGYQAKL